MEEEITSEGECLYCEKKFSQKEIGKHLAQHLTEMEKTKAANNPKTYCHIEVYSEEMFLHILVRGDATMKVIDRFLRDIWLDCCDHMSAFGHKNFKVSMSRRVEDVFATRVQIFHDYDFGTTTTVLLKGLKHYQVNLKENIILMSRNEPLKLMCATCKKTPAINICTACNWDKYSFFCEKCSKKHEKECEDFDDYGCMPVVNSPRMGECGYTGGSIDLKRDKPYKK